MEPAVGTSRHVRWAATSQYEAVGEGTQPLVGVRAGLRLGGLTVTSFAANVPVAVHGAPISGLLQSRRGADDNVAQSDESRGS